jgi:hypothetical protein
MLKGKTILFSPLDWGLGHATRSVPIIRQLQKDNTIVLGVTPLTKLIMDEEFPDLKQVELPSYQIEYSSTLPLWLKLGLDSPRITGVIINEHNALNKIIDEHKIDTIISDNRFGLYNKRTHNIFITHQVFLRSPILNLAAQTLNKNYILKFDELWIPDFENLWESLSGELSHGDHYHKNVKYIGPQSRLKDTDSPTLQKNYDVLILLSGPEPLRTDLENLLLEKLKGTEKKIAFVRGAKTVGNGQWAVNNNVEIFDFPEKEKLKGLILGSKKIICRSGYSTLMDMHILGKKDLVLIPTPGQTEQEYLAKYWEEKFGVKNIGQNKMITFTP